MQRASLSYAFLPNEQQLTPAFHHPERTFTQPRGTSKKALSYTRGFGKAAWMPHAVRPFCLTPRVAWSPEVHGETRSTLKFIKFAPISAQKRAFRRDFDANRGR